MIGFVRKECEKCAAMNYPPTLLAEYLKEGQMPQNGLQPQKHTPKAIKQRLYVCMGLWYVLGFITYPLFFVPLLCKLFPQVFDQYVLIYAEYLKLWGI